MTGIPRNTLIAWERRYGLLNPQRQPNGYRYYNDQDVGVLLQIKNALNAGLKISEAVSIVRKRDAPAPGNLPLPETPGTSLYRAESPGSPFLRLRDQLVTLLVAYRGEEAKTLIAQLVNVPFEVKLHEVFFPVLKEVGDRWESGEISVAQEHFASGVIRTHLAAQFVTIAQQPFGARHAVCTTLPHDEHEIGALALGIHLSQCGYRVSYLGSKLPMDALAGFVNKQQPDLVCVSCITLPPDDELQDYLRQLKEMKREGLRLVLGGRRLSERDPELLAGLEFYTDWRSFVA